MGRQADPCGCKWPPCHHQLLARFLEGSCDYRMQWLSFLPSTQRRSLTDLTWVFPESYHLVVNNPSTPTGPRAWILLVLIPTCLGRSGQPGFMRKTLTTFQRKVVNNENRLNTSAPKPNRAPSQNLVLALWKTAALQHPQTCNVMNSHKRVKRNWM